MQNFEKRDLKALAHHLNPVVIIGSKGLTNAVIEETNQALLAHELIKVKVNADDKVARKNMAIALCDSLDANFIQLIGNIAVIYRKNIS
ncbi:MAG: RNA-binding protein [Legionellales bacterium RIFCSPHIGHO2_12_FULL_35_11]|nr:MAG: RNA-binding protein [Legionellales bacterium RIFCSPHIGHO2_12_FULL_35_11]